MSWYKVSQLGGKPASGIDKHIALVICQELMVTEIAVVLECI